MLDQLVANRCVIDGVRQHDDLAIANNVRRGAASDGCSGVNQVVMTQISRRLVEYYTALRLSAGAATLFLPFEAPGPRAPIVRAAETGGPAGFDRREVIMTAGRVSVVTLPFTARQRHGQPPFGLN